MLSGQYMIEPHKVATKITVSSALLGGKNRKKVEKNWTLEYLYSTQDNARRRSAAVRCLALRCGAGSGVNAA